MIVMNGRVDEWMGVGGCGDMRVWVVVFCVFFLGGVIVS